VKKRRILIAGGALLLSGFAACEPYLSRQEALDGKTCVASDSCAPGYGCNAEGRCELGIETGTSPVLPPGSLSGMRGDAGTSADPSPVGAAGAGSEPAQGSAGASGNEPTSVGGTGGSLGSAGAGSMSVDTGGSGGDPAEPTPGVADAGCVPVLLFQDLDGDGFGGNTPDDIGRGCPPLAGFSEVNGDCHDAKPSPQDPAGDVFPGQTLFFSDPYPSPSGPSFDYDCSGREEPDPSPEFVPAQAECEDLAPPCGGVRGYREPATPRTGIGVNKLCGAIDRVNCSAATISSCTFVSITADSPFLCH
jgi:hypothetical protein